MNIIILGGGTAGWIAAACLAKVLLKQGNSAFKISLIESEEIGIIGVGEATIPSILEMLDFLNIDKTDFIKNTDATFKLGIEFKDWHELGISYFHPFGDLGPRLDNLPLYEFYLKHRQENNLNFDLQSLSICSSLAKQNKFEMPNYNNNKYMGVGYAYHFDAGKVGPYLRDYSIARGVKRIVGTAKAINTNEAGNISSILMADNNIIEGDFFIDCSGFSSLLIEKTLKAEYEDWSHLLFCDSAVAMPSENNSEISPYTIAHARNAGWTWKIPLQSRTGNGYVYSSKHIEKDAAAEFLINSISGKALADPRFLKFRPGKRKEPWTKNCLSLGLASGFLEPLESTNIHFVYANIYNFLDNFPNPKSDYELLRQRYNARATNDIEETRDFLILHYNFTKRKDSKFWQDVAQVQIPDSLAKKIEIFREFGLISENYYELFKPVSWLSVMDGMGIRPKNTNLLANSLNSEISLNILQKFKADINSQANEAKGHIEKLREIIN